MEKKKVISVIVPVYNEEKNVSLLHSAIKKVFKKLPYSYELIFVNDGSKDGSQKKIEQIAKRDPHVVIYELSRNFGKEIATTVGIHKCTGDACLMIDADLQHPPELIPKFIEKWEKGADVVIGVRIKRNTESITSKTGSYLFYKLMNYITPTKLVPGSTDFRLLDRRVITEFNKFGEKNRISRGLIDWLGFQREYISYPEAERKNGESAYSLIKKIRLAFNSIISLTLFPLRLVGYLGIAITVLSSLVAIIVFVEKFVLHDRFHWAITGTALLAIILIFLVGIILISLGLITLYIANIHEESIRRPLYIIKTKRQ